MAGRWQRLYPRRRRGDFIVTADPAVALYIDGVYVARSFART
jgi:hypothetical protein